MDPVYLTGHSTNKQTFNTFLQKIVEKLNLPRDKTISDFSDCNSYEWVHSEGGEDEVEEIKS